MTLSVAANVQASTAIYNVPPQDSTPELPNDCTALEYRIQQLLPLTYDYVPGVYEDDYNGAALILGTTMFWPAHGFLGYSGITRYQEQNRQLQTNRRIEQLRRAKARLHCFES